MTDGLAMLMSCFVSCLSRQHPHFGAEGEKARFCGRHKTDGMVNVKHRRCQQPGCRRERLFTDDPNTKPLYCSLHLAYEQRGIDPRSCDLDLPPGLASPVPPSKGRSSNASSASRNGGVLGNGANDANGGEGSNSSGSSGKGGNRGGGVGATGEMESSGSSFTPGAGLLPGLHIGTGRSPVSPGIHLGIPPSRESVAGSTASNTISAVAKKRASRMEMVEDDARSALQEQHMHVMQAHPSKRRLYEAQHRQALGVGGGAATAFSGSSLATSQAIRHDSRGFGAQTEQISFSGISAYSPATSSVPGSGFVDAPIPPRNPISSVSSVGGGGSIGMIGNGSTGPNMVTPSRLAPQSSMPQANATGPYAWSGACRGPSNSSGPGARVSALGGSSSFPGAGVGISGGASGGADMGGNVEGNQDMKPPPTEPPVHGPLHQYPSGRNTGGGSMSAAASSGNLAPVRLPGLGGGWGAPSSSAPTVLPGISNFRHLSAAAGAMLAETSGSSRQWSAYDASPGTAPSSAQQRSSAAQDAAVADPGHTLLRASQQHQGHDAGIPGGDGGQDIQQLLTPGWGGGSGSSAFQAFGGNLDGLDGLSWDHHQQQHQQHQLSQQHHQQRQRQLLVHQPRQHLPPSSQSQHQHHLHQRQHQLHQQQHPHHAGQQHLQHQQHLPSEQDQHNPGRLGASPQGFGGVRVPGPLHRLS